MHPLHQLAEQIMSDLSPMLPEDVEYHFVEAQQWLTLSIKGNGQAAAGYGQPLDGHPCSFAHKLISDLQDFMADFYKLDKLEEGRAARYLSVFGN